MLKNANFLEKTKTVKIVSSAGGSAPEPRILSPACYDNFVDFDSGTKCVLLPQKITK